MEAASSASSSFSRPLEPGLDSETGTATLPSTALGKDERMRFLRKKFCPRSMIYEETGEINHDYFYSKPKGSKWSDIENTCILDGIFKFGVDGVENWAAIAREHVPARSFGEVRLRLSEMLGTKDLTQYSGVKFSSEADIKREFEKNREKKASTESATPTVASDTSADVEMIATASAQCH